MGIFQQFRSDYTIEDWGNELKARFGLRTTSGAVVSEQSALRFVTVYSCAQVLAETMGSLPCHVFRERRGGGSDKVTDYHLYELVHDLPNDEMQSQTWMETKTGHLALSGNTYSILTPNGRGQIIDAYPAPWDQVTPQRNPETGRIEYAVIDRGKPEIYPADRVLHVPGWGYDGLKGYSRIRMAAQAVGLGMATAEFAERFYGQGMNVGTVLEFPQAMSDAAYTRMKEWVDQEGVGLGKSWRPFILEEGAKLNRIPMPFSDAQFIETRKFSREEICGLFRVPPHMIADLSRSTNNNIEHQSLEFVQFTMLPIVTRFERSMKWKMLSKREREQGYYIKFNLASLLRADSKSRAEFYHIMRQDGVYNADEIRAFEEMNPQEGGAGKAYLANGNLRSVTELMKAPATSKGVNQDGSQE